MTPQELHCLHESLEAFTHDLFKLLPRKDQRVQAWYYLCGLLLDGGRKSIRPMASRLPGGNAQALHHFVNDSPWDWRRIQRGLADRICSGIEPLAWTIDTVDFPKDGNASVGVHRCYSRRLARMVNCQIGVSVRAVTDTVGCPINWRLFLPKTWDVDIARRTAAHVPDTARHRPIWQLALDMLDELTGWRLQPPVVLVNGGWAQTREFVAELEERQLPYLVNIGGSSPSLKPAAGFRPWHLPRESSEGTVAGLAVNARRIRLDSAVHGPDGGSIFAAERIRLTDVKPGGHPIRQPVAWWLVLEWLPGRPEPVRSWLSNLSPQTELLHLIGLAQLAHRTEHDDRDLRTELGLDHFEGRSLQGWHHHVTLVSVAHAFLTLERMRKPTWQASGT